MCMIDYSGTLELEKSRASRPDQKPGSRQRKAPENSYYPQLHARPQRDLAVRSLNEPAR